MDYDFETDSEYGVDYEMGDSIGSIVDEEETNDSELGDSEDDGDDSDCAVDWERSRKWRVSGRRTVESGDDLDLFSEDRTREQEIPDSQDDEGSYWDRGAPWLWPGYMVLE